MRDISVAVAPLHMKEIANSFAVVVPVASVPVVRKLVEKVKVKLVVPLVVTMRVACWPAVQFEALIVSVWAGVRVNTVPSEKFIATVEPGVSAALPIPPFAAGKTPETCVARFTTVDAPIAANDASKTMTTNSRVRFCIHQYPVQSNFDPVGGAVR